MASPRVRKMRKAARVASNAPAPVAAPAPVLEEPVVAPAPVLEEPVLEEPVLEEPALEEPAKPAKSGKRSFKNEKKRK